LSRFVALGLALASAGMTAGCFQPLYGTASAVSGSPAVSSAMASVEIEQIDAPNGTAEARLGNEIRNDLIFGLTGGGGAASPAYRLRIQISGNNQRVIVDTTTARPDMEIYGIDATYSLTELASNKVVLTGRAFSRASYDIPGQQQRFARQRGERDAQNRSSGIIAEQIKSRLASYFVSGS
jgi:LPS-assembly lipoprotein